jgi:hypothetical protein
MSRTMRRLVTGLAAGPLALAVLVGCGGSDDDSTGGDTGSSTKSTEDAGPPTKKDYDEAADAIQDLSDAYKAVYDDSLKTQQAVVAYFKKNKLGSAEDDPAVEAAQTKMKASFEKRDQLRDGIAELDALDDPEVGRTAKTFLAAAEKQDTFNDAYYTEFPVLEQSFYRCIDVFGVTDAKPGLRSPQQYGALLVKRTDKALADCTPVLEQLKESENTKYSAYATDYLDALTARRAILQRMARGKASVADTQRRYIAVTKSLTAENKRNTDFQKEMARLNASKQFGAFYNAVEAKRKPASPSASPSSKPSS